MSFLRNRKTDAAALARSAGFFCLSFFLCHDSLLAQDRVTFTPPGSNSPVTAIGEVVDYTGRDLTLRTLNGTQHIDPVSITGIQTAYDPAHLRGIEEFEQGQTERAQDSFREALEREHRSWVQREIRAWLVKCALRNQDLAGALQEFRLIALSDPLTRHWSLAPLVWAPVSVSEAVRSEMRKWLKSQRESERLLAASLLLLDPNSGEAAEDQLDKLSRNSNPVLSAYGKAQLWRLDIGRRQVSEVQLEDWRRAVNRLQPELRSGPQYLMARGYEVRGELRRAAAESLWLPYVYPENEPLAARALLDAAESLERTGLKEEANLLQRELVQSYAWSREASQVRGAAQQPSIP